MPFAAAPEVLEFDRHAILSGGIWRLWSGHLVHYSAQHALIDIATALVAAVIAAQAFGVRRVLVALTLGAPLISGGLLLTAPDCLYYRGASGLAVMLTVMAGAGLWQRARRPARCALVLLALTLAAKIAAEALGLTLNWSDLPNDVAVAWQAHAVGALIGAAAARVRVPVVLNNRCRHNRSEAFSGR